MSWTEECFAAPCRLFAGIAVIARDLIGGEVCVLIRTTPSRLTWPNPQLAVALWRIWRIAPACAKGLSRIARLVVGGVNTASTAAARTAASPAAPTLGPKPRHIAPIRWIVILVAAPLRRPDWEIMPETFNGTIFLLALVTNASFMPVEQLPLASWQTALGLGFLSSVFDNIPLTALALLSRAATTGASSPTALASAVR
jgi:hypothetical protein